MKTLTKKPLPKPPKKLSELIKLALGDLRKAERSPKCVIDMGTWHSPMAGGCAVCAAGAVMRGTLGTPDYAFYHPDNFPKPWRNALRAINSLREGFCGSASHDLGLSIKNHNKASELSRRITRYGMDPKQFHADMRKLQRDLEEAGL